MKIGKSETDNVYVCYCMLREMHPGKHQTERLRKVTEALWDAQAFYEKMEALMFGQAFVYGSREVVVRPFTVYEEGFRETPEEFATIQHQRDITSLLRTAERFYARGGRADGGGRPEQRDVQTGDY